MSRPRLALLIQPSLRSRLVSDASLARLHELADVAAYDREDAPRAVPVRELAPLLADARVVFNSWGTPVFDEPLLEAAPRLELVVYLAGSVKAFQTEALWRRGVRVCSAAHAIGGSVAEYVIGLAILGRRNAYRFHDRMRGGVDGAGGAAIGELWGATLGVVSMGNIGKLVAGHARRFGARVLAFDPYVSDAALGELGAERVELDDLVRRSDVITLHAPNLPETRGMISRERLRAMKDGALLINTARGDLVDEAALIEELTRGRLFACLDVTSPEPPAKDSPLRSLPNVFLTPHVAGPASPRIGEQAVEEVRRFLAGEPQVYEMTRDRLAVTA